MALAMQNHANSFYRNRFARTVRCSLPSGGSPYSRGDYVAQLTKTVGCQALEAIGPTSRGNVWELTFSCHHEKTQFLDAGDFDIHGHKCAVSDLQKTRYRVRAHWLPHFLPNESIIANLYNHGCKVIMVLYDKSSVEELKHRASNLRTFTLETDQPTNIPHFVDWHYLGMAGCSILTMMGRKPTCLRCDLNGHVRKNCDTPFCRYCKRYGHEMDTCTGGRWAGLPAKSRQKQTSSTTTTLSSTQE